VRVLLTGGAGFIGSHIASALSAAGTDVVVLDALLPTVHADTRPTLPEGVDFIEADVRDPHAVSSALRGIDAVCHQAAMVGLGKDIADLPDYAGCNDLGTAVLLAAMASSGVRRLVLASSMVVYGEGRYRCEQHSVVEALPRTSADLDAGIFEPRCPHCGAQLAVESVPEDAALDPRNVYAATKTAQEHLARAWARETASSAIALRYHNVYGPGMPRDTPYAGVAAMFRSALTAGRAPNVFEDGGQRRDFVHVHDVAHANVLALHAGERNSFIAYNVASGHPCTIGDVARSLADAAGGPPPEVTGQYRLGDVRHIVANPRKAAAHLGFVAKISWREGIPRFADEPMRPAAPERASAAT
jgi:dTDP-L-rhamnose 4-epimerase